MSLEKNTLLCDMGGTHARFARHVKHGEYTDFKKYRLHDFTSFEDIVQTYIDDVNTSFQNARFAVARTPQNGVISYKRFAGDPDYEIDFNNIKAQFKWSELSTLNDLEAGAYGVTILVENQIQTILPEIEKSWNENKLLISIGTGVGHAGIFNNQIMQTSGGHFLPVTVTEEHRVFEKFIRDKKDKEISLIMEDFVSARGLRMIAEYTSGQPNDKLSNLEFFQHLKTNLHAVKIFFEFMGMHAHILTSVTSFYGGVYLTGGVIDYLIKNDLTDWGAFESYFRPPMLSTVNERLSSCPVHYVLHDELPLLGLTTL